jgi:hypothetical protein
MMTVIVLLSPGGSPGVTSTALALVLVTDVIVAECDPAGRAVLVGMGQAAEVGEGCCGSAARRREAQAAGQTISARAVPLENRAAAEPGRRKPGSEPA